MATLRNEAQVEDLLFGLLTSDVDLDVFDEEVAWTDGVQRSHEGGRR